MCVCSSYTSKGTYAFSQEPRVETTVYTALSFVRRRDRLVSTLFSSMVMSKEHEKIYQQAINPDKASTKFYAYALGPT